MMNRRKMIVDCDTGTDDAVALIALLLAEQIEVIGITSIFGNLPAEDAAKNSLSIVQMLKKDVPVYIGCAHALTAGLFPGRTLNTLTQCTQKLYQGEEVRIHEISLGLPADRLPEREPAVSFLVRTLRAAEEPIDVCATGPLTNLAVAFLIAPDIAKKIGTLYIMGGGISIGNRTPVAEANFVDDPEAAAQVFLSGANILLSPIEANESGATYFPKEIAQLEAVGSDAARFVAELLQKFLWRCSYLWEPGFDLPPYQLRPNVSCCIHDWAAVAPAIDPKTVKTARAELCRVDCSGGMANGQLIIDRRGFSDEKNATVVYDMDEPRCKALLLQLLRKSNIS